MADPIPGDNEYDYMHINWYAPWADKPKPKPQQIRDEAGDGINPAEYEWHD